MDAAAEVDHGNANQRGGEEGEQRQAPIHAEHHDYREHEGEAGLGEVHDTGARHHADGIEVAGRSRHDVAGAIARVEAGGKRDQVLKEVVADFELDVARNADEDHPHPILKVAFDSRNANQRGGEPKDGLNAEAALQRIDSGANHQRIQYAEAVLGDQRAHAERGLAFVLAQVRPQRRQCLPHQPDQDAMVFTPSTRKIFCPSRVVHQASAW